MDSSSFPKLCKSCLGDNKFIRMIKRPLNDECKICLKIFTSFNWKKDKESKYLKTVVCQNCSISKNICQCCILDLEFKIPYYERDSIILNNSSLIDNLREKQKDKIITNKKKLIHPADKNIKSLFLSNLNTLNDPITDNDLKINFEIYGKILSIKRNQDTALITFQNRLDAEIAIESLYNKLIINGNSIKLLWAKQKKIKNEINNEKEIILLEKNFEKNNQCSSLPLPPGNELFIYPSMKPISSKIFK